MPVGLPPGMDPGVARELVEYLRANPEVAKQTYTEAQRLLQVGLLQHEQYVLIAE